VVLSIRIKSTTHGINEYTEKMDVANVERRERTPEKGPTRKLKIMMIVLVKCGAK